MNSKIYKEILSDEIMHHYFLVTKNNQVVDISLINIASQLTAYNITYLTFNIQPNKTISENDVCEDPT